MLIDWIHWLSSLHQSELLLILSPILLLDAPRYAIGSLMVWVCDFTGDIIRGLTGRPEIVRFDHAPQVCVIIAGLNEAESLGRALKSLVGTYPHLHTVVVDDGSTDGMSEIANEFARARDDVTVIRKPDRGGKSSALNAALPYTTAEILVCVDSDSNLGENAIWEIVQPFKDPRIGAVSGCVLVHQPLQSWAAWFQALEYMRCIFIGRMLTSRLGILGIVSGAFGAFRRQAVLQVGAWDVGPGEDGDITLRLRKAGYEIEFAPYAQCYTNPVSQWKPLTKQRRRWEWAVITLESRKHLDMANPLNAEFRRRNLMMLIDRWLYSVIFPYTFAVYIVWQCFHLHDKTFFQYLLYYAVYLVFEILQLFLLLYYTQDRRAVLTVALLFPLMPFYYAYMRLITLWAITEELIHRRSYKDNFVPEHVRRVTWHW